MRERQRSGQWNTPTRPSVQPKANQAAARYKIEKVIVQMNTVAFQI